MRTLLGLFLLVVCAALQVSGGVILHRAGLSVDLLLVCVLCAALVGDEAVTISVAVAAAFLKDSFSASFFGHSVAVFLPLSIVVRRLRVRLWIDQWTTQALVAVAATFIAAGGYNIIAAISGTPPERGVLIAAVEAVLNSAFILPLYRVWRAVLE